ncbi:MAG TPA: Ish1 domain-containing protein [Chthoniobacterales bacterium]|nr:Ish1 domain-containing protein [Chthoniobacterales bacterium]
MACSKWLAKQKLIKERATVNRDQLLKFVEPLLRCPTAPTFEAAVSEEICRQLGAYAGIQIEKDNSVI